MRYIVEARARDRWVAVGHPHLVRTKAFEKFEAVLESSLYDEVRVSVVDQEGKTVEVLR